MGCVRLHGALAEFDRQREGLLARRNGPVEISCYPAYMGQTGQHSFQPGAIINRPG
jgi:hypothetical protein